MLLRPLLLLVGPISWMLPTGVASARSTEVVPGPTARLSYTATPSRASTIVDAVPGGRPLLRLRTAGAAVDDPSDLGDGLLVLGSKADRHGHLWYRVQLLQRPRGHAGYVDSDLVDVTANPYRVAVRLRRRTVTVYRAGRVVRRTRAVVGRPSTPTPLGLYAITRQVDCVQFTCSSAFVGSAINLLTAYSPAYQDIGFGGGAGIVAIHGRGSAALADPLGSARSHGCVRVPNAVATWILRTLLPGTPVQITR